MQQVIEPLERRALLSSAVPASAEAIHPAMAADGTGSIAGVVFEDVNANGIQDAGEGIAAGTQYLPVYIDMNASGTYDSGDLRTYPDAATGAFRFDNVPAGIHFVHLTTTANNYQLVQAYPSNQANVFTNVTAGQTNNIVFGVRRSFTVYGTVFNDLDNNNSFSVVSDTAYSGRTVYDDANNNGQFDSGETSAVTDSTGFYELELFAGPHTLREVVPTGFAETKIIGLGMTHTGSVPLTFSEQSSAASASISFVTVPQTPVGTVTSFIFNDANGNGVLDSGESHFTGSGITAYLDLNHNGVYDSGDLSSSTAGSGSIGFKNVPVGTYNLLLNGLSAAGLQQTTPAPAAAISVTVTAGQTTYVTAFGVQRINTVAGFVVHDTNDNGLADPGESSLTPGDVVFVDSNNNGRLDAGEPSFTTQVDGWHFTLAPGTYTICQQLPAGYVQTYPYGGNGLNVTVTGNETATLRPGNFLRYQMPAPTPTLSISGNVYNDLNGNGVKDANELGIYGQVVKLYLINGGATDLEVDSVLTDSKGNFAFYDVSPGGYKVVPTVPTGYAAITPAQVQLWDMQTITGLSFGEKPFGAATVTGRIFYDVNADGIYDEGDSFLDGDVYVDTNNNGISDAGDAFRASQDHGASGYTLQLPANGQTFRLKLDSPSSGQFTTPTSFDIKPVAGQTMSGYDFGIADPTTATQLVVSGTVYNDANKNYKRDTGEAGLPLVRVYVDANNNSKLDDGEYATYTNPNGFYQFHNLPATGKSATVRVVLPAGYSLKYPSSNGGYPITLTAKAKITAKDFGLNGGPVLPPVSVSGSVYNDVGQDGIHDPSDPAVAGVTVFADLNNNGTLDASEPKATTASNGTYTLSVPSSAGGAVAAVRIVQPSGYTSPFAPSVQSYPITLGPGDTYTLFDFRLYKSATPPPPVKSGLITGLAFNDSNKNGKYDTGDTVAAGKTIWLDLDNDGVKDSNEPSVVTGSDGSFSFKNLAAGTYHVRRVFPTGYVESTPARTITLSTGQTVSGVQIGSKLK